MQATIVSFLPWKVEVVKPGVIPDSYTVPAAVGKIPGILVIEDAVTPVYMDGERGSFRMPITAEKLAKSITEDYYSAFLGADSECHAAMFWIPGAFTASEVLSKFVSEVETVKSAQNLWFIKLVRLADDDWNKYHQHKMITDIQRYAARNLSLTREWAIEPIAVSMINCPACRTLLEETAIVCKNCKAILKPEEAKKLGLAFATA